MSKQHDHTVAHQAADVVDNVADGMRAAAHTVGGKIHDAAQTTRDTAGRVVDRATDTCDDMGQRARGAFDRTRARARSLESSLESCVGRNPLTALLAAAAFGAVIGALWRRR